MGTARRGGAQTSERGKRKIIAALAVLLLAFGWVIYYVSTMGGAKAAPQTDPVKIAEIEATNAKERQAAEKQAEEGRHGSKKVEEPRGS